MTAEEMKGCATVQCPMYEAPRPRPDDQGSILDGEHGVFKPLCQILEQSKAREIVVAPNRRTIGSLTGLSG